MKRVLLGRSQLVAEFVKQRVEGLWSTADLVGIGLVEDDRLIAGVLYDCYNGSSMCMHVAAVPGRHWMTKDFLRVVFAYPFRQVGVQKLIGLVGSGNVDARRFDENIGFVLEATLKGAHPDGDLLVYTMTREQCRWLNIGLKVESHGKVQSPAAA